MASTKKSGLSILMMVVLFATCFLRLLDATRIDLDEHMLEGPKVVYVKESMGREAACCDSCPCTKSIPPQCRCSDVKPYCYSGCNFCLCTREYIPSCKCLDITDACLEPCSDAAAHSRNRMVS